MTGDKLIKKKKGEYTPDVKRFWDLDTYFIILVAT